ncbi:alpha-N-arabinofuranosidase [Dyella sp. 2RAB6]|uniref:alpha-N-arabinofuranosidase n=1 Tax=Dyella sp. 2RAB6 TaxID=3232992 RepID=UPI003F903691
MALRTWVVALGCCVSFGVGGVALAAPPTAQVTVHVDRPGALIHREIYGQFAEQLGRGIDEGLWVGEGSPIPNVHGFRKDVVDALKAIHVPVIRWPGGCFADEYHWRDGIGARDKRAVRPNHSWGGEEHNAVGTHEFMDFAELVGAQTYLAANMGTGSPREMSDWLEYVTGDGQTDLVRERRANGRKEPWKVAYLGIGNESWGCGGHMRGAYYADQYRQYATFARAMGGQTMLKVASGANADDYAWTEAVMAGAAEQIDAYGVHYYTLPTGDWKHKGSAVAFDEKAWIATLKAALRMDELVARHSAIMDKYDPARRIALAVDEWGTWYDTEPGDSALYQQSSLRDAMVAAITLDIFHAHAERVRMANIAQMVNVLQAMILTDKASTGRIVLTPTYHVFDLYQVFQGATSLPVEVRAGEYAHGGVQVPGLFVTAARGADGAVHVALVNPDPEHPLRVAVALPGMKVGKVSGRVLTAPAINTVNSFDRPDAVKPVAFEGARIGDAGVLAVSLPAKAIVTLELR